MTHSDLGSGLVHFFTGKRKRQVWWPTVLYKCKQTNEWENELCWSQSSALGSGDLWCVLRAVRWLGLQVYRLDPDLNWLPIKQSAYLTSLPLPVPLSCPVKYPPRLHLLLILPTSIAPSSSPSTHPSFAQSNTSTPFPPPSTAITPSPFSVTSTYPLYLKPPLSIGIQQCLLSPSPSISHLSSELISALLVSYTFSQSIHQSLLK